MDLSVTAIKGCPAVLTSGNATITAKFSNIGAMTVALSIAAKSGLHVVDPMELDDRPISFNFEQVSGVTAMQYIAQSDGRNAVFDGKNVHLESR